MSEFVPRKTSPSPSDRHWLKTTRGGVNECLDIGGGSVLPNCVGYAWGRFYEIIGSRPKLSTGNAENWYPNTADGYERSSTPKLGAVACWRKGQEYNSADGYGHVAVVEEIMPNGDIVCSNSAYGGSRFYMKTYLRSEGYNSGALTFQGFILPPVEFGVSVSADELAKEIAQRLSETGCEWGDVKELVDALVSASPEIKVGNTVTVKTGAADYNGGKLASYVYDTRYIVQELKGDRAVIGLDGKVTAAVNVKNLTLV